MDKNAGIRRVSGAGLYKIGRKICMLICHVGGLSGYIVMYLSGQEWNSYWGYFFGQILNGLFSGAFTIVSAYIGETMSKEEAEGPQGIIYFQ